MLRLIAAGFIGYWIGKRTLPQAMQDVEDLIESNEHILSQLQSEIDQAGS